MAGRAYRTVTDLPQAIPVFPLDGALLLPGGLLPLRIFEPRYLNMVDDAMAGDRIIGMVQTEADSDRARPTLVKVGCAGRITSYAETGDGAYLITLTGVCRFRVAEELPLPTPYRQVRADFGRFALDLDADEATLEFERTPFLGVLRRYLDQRGLGVEWEAINAAPAPALINSLAMALPFDPVEKQALLEAADLDERRKTLTALLRFGAAAGPESQSDDDDAPPSLH
jgi:Lon protease-like protein